MSTATYLFVSNYLERLFFLTTLTQQTFIEYLVQVQLGGVCSKSIPYNSPGKKSLCEELILFLEGQLSLAGSLNGRTAETFTGSIFFSIKVLQQLFTFSCHATLAPSSFYGQLSKMERYLA